MIEIMKQIAEIAEGSTTANSLQHIAKIARQAIAEAEKQEPEAAPVAKNEGGKITWMIDDWPQNCLLYTHTPQQRTWVGLTDDDLSDVYNSTDWDITQDWCYERAIEAKLKQKNT